MARKLASRANRISIGQDYFQRIRECWRPVAKGKRIIPFCTPVIRRPTALVIGMNHSLFAAEAIAMTGPCEKRLKSDYVAEELSKGVPTSHTYLSNTGKTFVSGLREVCRRADITIDKKWVGTNRCGIQTGPDGLADLKKLSCFRQCQACMDEILRELVEVIRPRNVLLIGKYAAALYFPSGNIRDLKPQNRETKSGHAVRVIALQHPSYATFWADAAKRLKKSFVRP